MNFLKKHETAAKTLAVLLLSSFFGVASGAVPQTDQTKIGAWTITGNKSISLDKLPQLQNGVDFATAIVDEYRKKGFLTVEARVDQNSMTIQLSEVGTKPTGAYSEYVQASDSMLTTESMALSTARIGTASSLNGELVDIQIMPSDPQTGCAEIRISTAPNPEAKKVGGNVGYSNSGQRYSASDLISAYGWANIGSAQQIDISLAHGLSDLNNESKGGWYDSAAFGWRKASRFGLTSINYASTGYKVGGSMADLDLSGNVQRASIEHMYLASTSVTVVGRLSQIENQQNFGLTGWTDKQSYSTLFAGVRYQAPSWSMDGGVEQGVGGNQNFSVAPLLGPFNPHFSVLTINAAKGFDVYNGWTVNARGGIQTGSKATPSSSQFSLGGPDRGRSYNTGYVSTPKGAFASLVVNSPVFVGVQAYAGIDSSTGSPVVGPDRKAQSAFVGLRFTHKSLTGELGYAYVIGQSDDATSNEKLNVSVSASF